jgi:hypothetical protein
VSRSIVLLVGVATVVAVVLGLLRAPYLIEWNAGSAWAATHLGPFALVGAFSVARFACSQWWRRTRVGSRIWLPFLAALLTTGAGAELVPYVNAHIGPQIPVPVRGTVRAVTYNRSGGPSAIIQLASGQDVDIEVTWDERASLRPGMAFDAEFRRGGLGLLYRER